MTDEQIELKAARVKEAESLEKKWDTAKVEVEQKSKLNFLPANKPAKEKKEEEVEEEQPAEPLVEEIRDREPPPLAISEKVEDELYEDSRIVSRGEYLDVPAEATEEPAEEEKSEKSQQVQPSGALVIEAVEEVPNEQSSKQSQRARNPP